MPLQRVTSLRRRAQADVHAASHWLRFGSIVQTTLDAETIQTTSALEVFLNDVRYIDPRFTYLLTTAACCGCRPRGQSLQCMHHCRVSVVDETEGQCTPSVI